jgi:hypothetical protein
MPFGTTISAEGDVMKYADKVFDDISSMDWSGISNRINTGGALTLPETRQVLNLFANDIPQMNQPGQGMLLNANGGAILTFGHIGISANVFGYGALDPTVDAGVMSFNSNTIDATTRVGNIVPGAADRSALLTADGNSLASAIETIFINAGILAATAQKDASELVYQAELAGVNTSDPNLRSLVTSIAQATAGGTTNVSVNTSGITISGIALKEVGISYGRPVMGNLLSVGGTLKAMEGQTYYKFFRFDTMGDGSDLMGDMGSKSNTKTSTTFGVDAGALLSLTDSLRVGLVGKNLNKPKFNWAGPGDYEMDPQFRFGAALKLTNMLTLAADYDLTKNKTDSLPGYESQVVGAGVELNLIGTLKVRGGIYDNIASDEAGPVYTAGLGFHLLFFDADLAVAMSSDEVQLEMGTGGTTDVAERYSLALSIALRF